MKNLLGRFDSIGAVFGAGIVLITNSKGYLHKCLAHLRRAESVRCVTADENVNSGTDRLSSYRNGTRWRPKKQRVLVCGGRNYSDRGQLFAILDQAHYEIPIVCLIHGAARGADSLAGQWAREHSIPEQRFPADWDKYGKSAGYRRNQRMLLESNPDIVIAFPGGSGTENMKRLARNASVPISTVPKSSARNRQQKTRLTDHWPG
jgi:hypothetical protein